jgi:LmbE family N-acetylglucosaminyl deacetylase
MRILAIAPHPDDETLGCGGTLLKHKADGDTTAWLIVTRGHEPQWSAQTLEQKEREIEKVQSAYGFEQIFRAGLPTIKLDSLPLEQLMLPIHQAISSFQPDLVYLNHANDAHSDHRAVFSAATSVLKPFNSKRDGVKRVLSYEVLGSTDAMAPNQSGIFAPNVFVEVTEFIERKLEIMSLYETEIHEYPLPRSVESIRALARYRGSTIGCPYAEAFTLVREVQLG